VAAHNLVREPAVGGIVLNYRDVDSPNGPEREQSLDRRLSTEKFESLARFAGGVAHDFNNQLTVILGQTEWLAGLAGSESARLAIDEVERAAVRLTNLVREFGSYGGHEYPETITADLARLVLDLVEESRPSLPERIRLEVAAAPDCEALVDAEMFREALRALLHNAVEALCVGPGRILIEVGSLEATPENLEDFFDAGHARICPVSSTPSTPPRQRAGVWDSRECSGS
jgi:signal transduction histidine kinase